MNPFFWGAMGDEGKGKVSTTFRNADLWFVPGRQRRRHSSGVGGKEFST